MLRKVDMTTKTRTPKYPPGTFVRVIREETGNPALDYHRGKVRVVANVSDSGTYSLKTPGVTEIIGFWREEHLETTT